MNEKIELNGEIPYKNLQRQESLLNLLLFIEIIVITILLWNITNLFPLEKITTRNVIFKNKNKVIYEIYSDQDIPFEITSNSIRKYIFLRENWNSKNKNPLKKDLVLFENLKVKNKRNKFEKTFNNIINKYQSFQRKITFINEEYIITKNTFSIKIKFFDKINGIIQSPKTAEIRLKYKFIKQTSNPNLIVNNKAMIEILNYSINTIE